MVNRNLNIKTLELLLKKVKSQFGFPIVHAKDCANLSLDISKITRERISSSTIKRLLGFVITESKPNTYTLNLLSKYIGFDNYETFELSIGNKNKIPLALEITNQTIKQIQHSSQLKSEDWFENTKGLVNLNSFLSSKLSCTAIIGEGGIGKSSLLTQFVIQLDNTSTLFISSAYLNKLKGTEDLLLWFENQFENINLIVIDGIEETAYNYDKLKNFFIELGRFTLNKRGNLKVIISIRPFSWIKLRASISNKIDWYNVNFNSQDLVTICNIPKLSVVNVKQKLIENVNESLIELLRFPLFFQLYSHSKLESITNDFELLKSFFSNTIFETSRAFEKNEFITEILKYTKNGELSSSIPRKEIEYLIIKYKRAFLELVSFNVLKETKSLNKFGTFTSEYSFGHEIYLDYAIISRLLENNKGYNQTLIENINKSYNGERKLSLLKLAISFALSEYNTSVSTFYNLELSEFERQSIQNHLGYQIRVNKRLQAEILPLFLNEESGRKYFIERWIDEGNLDGFYGNVLKEYLKIVNEPQDVMFANALLYYKEYLNGGANCKQYIDVINKIESSSNIHPFVLGRKYMTLLLDTDDSDESIVDLRNEIQSYIELNLKESKTDLPVHSFGLEQNILRAEFLSESYYFTPALLKKIKGKKIIMNHNKDYDLMLFQIFEEGYKKRVLMTTAEFTICNEEIDNIHPWYRKTVKTYLDRLNQ